jgi:hypothetical protein
MPIVPVSPSDGGSTPLQRDVIYPPFPNFWMKWEVGSQVEHYGSMRTPQVPRNISFY